MSPETSSGSREISLTSVNLKKTKTRCLLEPGGRGMKIPRVQAVGEGFKLDPIDVNTRVRMSNNNTDLGKRSTGDRSDLDLNIFSSSVKRGQDYVTENMNGLGICCRTQMMYICKVGHKSVRV